MKLLLCLLIAVPGTLWAQSLSITRGDCYDQSASACASGGANVLPIDTTIRCGEEFVYTINNQWCFDFYDLPGGWYTNEDSSELLLSCLDVGEYLFEVYQYLDGPDPGNPSATVTCETYEYFTLTVVPLDTTWRTATTCDLDSVGVFLEHLATEACGCDSIVLTTRIFGDCDEEEDEYGNIFFPTVFSSHHDGINDFFFPFAGEGVVDEIIEMSVFDRWGNWVWKNTHFQVNDPTQGWDGTFRGDLCEQDVFVWSAYIRFVNGTTTLYKGEVTLVR